MNGSIYHAPGCPAQQAAYPVVCSGSVWSWLQFTSAWNPEGIQFSSRGRASGRPRMADKHSPWPWKGQTFRQMWTLQGQNQIWTFRGCRSAHPRLL